jgi:hypothetical protein
MGRLSYSVPIGMLSLDALRLTSSLTVPDETNEEVSE